jgi:uncharacterized membrane protein
MQTAPPGAADMAIADYLDDLRDVLAPLPRDRRRELVRDLESHIGAARAELDDPWSEAQVRTLLERLGSPEEIAEAEGLAAPEPPAAAPAPAPATSSWREPAAIVLLLFGGFVALVGWLVGLVLLWSSPRWNVRDKLIGTLVFPGGLATSAFVAALVAGTSGPCAIANGAAGLGLSCDTGPALTTVILFLALLLLPFATSAWLALRLRRTAA